MDLRKGELSSQGHTVVMQQGNAVGICQVVLTEDVVVPARSEMILFGRVTPGEDGGDEVPQLGALEGARDLSAETDVVVARALVSPQQSTTPVRVLNVRDSSVKLLKGDMIASFHPVSELTDRDVRPWCKTLSNGGMAVKLPGHLQSLVDECSDQLSSTERRQLAELILEFVGSFSAPGKKLGLTHVAEHTIETGETLPIYQANRRLPYATRQAAVDEKDRMLKEGVIEPSSSPWCSSIFLVSLHPTGKKVPFEWTVECEVAFQKLKEAITTPPVLVYPLPNGGIFILDTDASGVGR